MSNIVVKDEYAGSGTPGDYDWYRSLAFYYTTGGQVWQVLWDKWKLDGGGNIVDYDAVAAREFRYDTPRARYLSRPVDPDTFEAGALGTWDWTCYDGDEPYGDFSVALNGSGVPIATDVLRYFAGATAQQLVSNSAIQYNHGDLIGSTIATSDSAGDGLATTAYMAFGERGPGAANHPWQDTDTRYAYAGAHGPGVVLANRENAGARVRLCLSPRTSRCRPERTRKDPERRASYGSCFPGGGPGAADVR